MEMSDLEILNYFGEPKLTPLNKLPKDAAMTLLYASDQYSEYYYGVNLCDDYVMADTAINNFREAMDEFNFKMRGWISNKNLEFFRHYTADPSSSNKDIINKKFMEDTKAFTP